MFTKTTTAAVLALIGAGSYGYSTLDIKIETLHKNNENQNKLIDM